MTSKRVIELIVTVLACALGFSIVLGKPIVGAAESTEPQARKRPQRARPGTGKASSIEYSRFLHTSEKHRLPCDTCHKVPTANWNKIRSGDAAFPDVTDYPKHDSCLGCHRREFFTGAQPKICSVCHTNPSPRDSSRYPFPNPPEIFDASARGQRSYSEFAISFPHDKHADLVGTHRQSTASKPGLIQALFTQDSKTQDSKTQDSKTKEAKAEETDPKSCGVCHKTYAPQGDSDDEYVTKAPANLAEDSFWLKKGAFKTTPTHAVCFTCHTTEGLQPLSSECGTCHKLQPPDRQIRITTAHDDFDPKLAETIGIKDKLMLGTWSRRDTAKFRHEWIPHASLSCSSCHTVATLNTLDPKSRVKVKSCGGTGTGCHIEATSDGILNQEFEKKKANPAFQCTKCHIQNGKNPAPESHIAAIAAATKK